MKFTEIVLEDITYRTMETDFPLWQVQNNSGNWVAILTFETALLLTKMLRESKS